MKGCLRALIGLPLIFAYHIPKLIYHALLVSYAYVFNNYNNLTADPAEHLARARRLLKRDNSHLLYAALEIRFALERMVHTELVFASKSTERVLKEYDPVKKLKALHRLDEATKHHHKIIFISRKTGERFDWGEYKPLDLDRVTTIQGRLGDLLHPKTGLSLGIRNDPWYIQTRRFLEESRDYLENVRKGNSHFFSFEALDHIELLPTDRRDDAT